MKINKRKAQKDIYLVGKSTPDPTKKSGLKYTRTEPSETEKDQVIVKRGEVYYSWGIWGEDKLRISLTYPTRNQLTVSEYKLRIYDIEDKLFETQDVETAKNEIKGYIKELRDKISRLPFHLQDKHVGALLSNRIHTLILWLEELKKNDEPIRFQE